MADLTVFRLMGAGPSTLLQAVDSESVEVDPGIEEHAEMGQALAPIAVFAKSISRMLKLSQAYVGYSAPAEEASFGTYWQAYSDAGGLGSGGISTVGKALIIPQNVRCSKNGVAKSTVRVIYLDAAPTLGVVTVTPATVDHIYLNGPSTFNGSALAGIEEQELDFGFTVMTDVGHGGKLYPTKWWIARNAPTMRIRTTDLGVVKTYLAGATLTSAAAVMKFMNETGSAGFGYTMAKAYVKGSVSGAMGTLSLTAINGTTILAGATY